MIVDALEMCKGYKKEEAHGKKITAMHLSGVAECDRSVPNIKTDIRLLWLTIDFENTYLLKHNQCKAVNICF